MNRNSKLIFLWALACLTLTSCSRWVVKANVIATEGVPVRTAVAVARDIPLELSAVGNVEALDHVDVKSRIVGQIKRVAFEEGQSVKKGQLLFTIDADPLQRQVAEQQAELERDTAMEHQARAVVARDSASLKQSQSEALVALELAKDGIVAKQRADQLATTSETAGAALHSDQAAVEAAAGTIKADNARLAQTQLQLSFTSVVAPIAGRTGTVMVKAGNLVRENDTALVTLLQLNPIHVSFGVPEQFLPEIQRLNASEDLAVEASNGNTPVVKGNLVFIDNTVDPTTGTIKLKAEFTNANGVLWPGVFVNVRLRLRMEKNMTVIPAASIQDGLDGKFVWLVRAGSVTTKPVIVSRTYTLESGLEEAVLGGGINPGDTVVTEGQLRLTGGTKIISLNSSMEQPSHTPPSQTRPTL